MSQAVATAQQNQNDTLSHEDTMEWYMRLYPDGNTLENEILTVAEDNHTNYSTAKYLINDIISKHAKIGRMKIASKENAQRVQEPHVQLTDLGKQIMWEYLTTRVYPVNPRRFLLILREWSDKKDEKALSIYKKILYQEINKNYNICYKLTTPTTKQDLLSHVSRLMDKKEDDPEVLSVIDNFMTRAVLVGIISTKIQQMIIPPPSKEPNSPPQLVEIEIYYLSDDGKNGLKIFDQQLSSLTFETGMPTANPTAPHREILINKYDMPIKKFIKIEMIVTLIYILFFILLNNSLVNYYISTIMTGLPASIYYEENSTRKLLNIDTAVEQNVLSLMPFFFSVGMFLIWLPFIGAIFSEFIGKLIHQKFKKQQKIV